MHVQIIIIIKHLCLNFKLKEYIKKFHKDSIEKDDMILDKIALPKQSNIIYLKCVYQRGIE